jgi:hypothetical protein
MKFYIEYCNAPPFNTFTDEQWSACVAEWVEAMKSPSYLRVGGRLVFVIHDGSGFFQRCGQSVEKCQAYLNILRDAVRKAGLGELVIGGGNLGIIQNPNNWTPKVFAFTTDYMLLPDLPILKPQATPYSYRQLTDYLNYRRSQETNVIPYLPPLAAGWDALPWRGENQPRHFYSRPGRSGSRRCGAWPMIWRNRTTLEFRSRTARCRSRS